jgi:glycosyltransferase involved in cell wall biosynthesis
MGFNRRLPTINKNKLKNYYSLPNKFFEYCMAGLPVIVNSFPEIKKLVESYNCGVICPINSKEALEHSINQILGSDLQLLANNSRKIAKDFNWELQEEKLLKIYRGQSN